MGKNLTDFKMLILQSTTKLIVEKFWYSIERDFKSIFLLVCAVVFVNGESS